MMKAIRISFSTSLMTVSQPSPTVTPRARISGTRVTADMMSVHTTGAWASLAPASAIRSISRSVVSMAWTATSRSVSAPMEARCSRGRWPNSDTASSISSRSRLMWVITPVPHLRASSSPARKRWSEHDGTPRLWTQGRSRPRPLSNQRAKNSSVRAKSSARAAGSSRYHDLPAICS